MRKLLSDCVLGRKSSDLLIMFLQLLLLFFLFFFLHTEEASSLKSSRNMPPKERGPSSLRASMGHDGGRASDPGEEAGAGCRPGCEVAVRAFAHGKRGLNLKEGKVVPHIARGKLNEAPLNGGSIMRSTA